MKIAKTDTTYEYKNVILVHTRSERREDSVNINFCDQEWQGSLRRALDMSEAIRSLDDLLRLKTDLLHLKTLNAAEPLASEPLASEPLASDPFASPKTSAQGPDPKDGEIIVQMTVERFSELLDLANSVILAEERFEQPPSSPVDGKVLKLAKLVTQLFGGRSVGT